jgi:hypothetical protein
MAAEPLQQRGVMNSDLNSGSVAVEPLQQRGVMNSGFCKAHGGRGQALPTVGLLEVRCRRHRPRMHCKARGGGRRCQQEGCSKACMQLLEATRNTGSRTEEAALPCMHHEGSIKSSLEATRSTSDELTVLYTEHCIAHGGGRRCQHEGCPKAAASVRRNAALQGAWWRQAVPARRNSKSIVRAPGSTLCTLCLLGKQPQPDSAEAQ